MRRIGYATDLGVITPAVEAGLLGCEAVVLECNHDPEMLRNGPYPYWLVQRIRGQGGHLSNEECAVVLPRLVQAGATRIVLAHLSEKNNTPALARQCACSALTAAGAAEGRDYLLSVAKPTGDSPVTYF